MDDQELIKNLEEAVLQRERQMFGLASIIRELRRSPFEPINRNSLGICDISDDGLRALGIRFVDNAKETRNTAG